VDVLEEYHRRPDKYEMEGLELPGGMNPDDYGEWLHDQACKNNITIIDGMGFAPGLSNITVGNGLRKLDHADTAIARVGGIPDKDTSLSHPLCYVITWAFHHVIREYNVKVLIIQDGKVKEVDALTERESFRFEHFGKNFDLEAAITPGMPSFIYTRPNLLKFCEKTIRWPGHWIAIDTLKECGLFDLEPITFNGGQIIPRDFFSALITPRLLPCDTDKDVCVMYNTVLGTKDGKKVRIDYYMWNEDDQANGLTAMMRATAFPATGTALLLAKGEIDRKGIVAPEDAIYGSTYSRLLKDLEERNVIIKEVETKGD
jgi:saccharopine dehydrogenase-like NADP-dependent oxidoreductase